MILTRFFMGGFDKRITILIVLLLLLALLVPILHLVVPPTNLLSRANLHGGAARQISHLRPARPVA